MLCSLLTTICNPHCLAAVLLASHHECAKETWLECKNNKTITHTQDLAAYELEVFPLNIHCASQHCLFCSRCWIRHSYPLCQHFRNAFIFSFAHAECLVKFAFALKTRLEQTLSLAVKCPSPTWSGWVEFLALAPDSSFPPMQILGGGGDGSSLGFLLPTWET